MINRAIRTSEHTPPMMVPFVWIICMGIVFMLYRDAPYIYIPNGNYHVFNKTNCKHVELRCYDSSNIKVISKTKKPEFEVKEVVRNRTIFLNSKKYFIEKRFMKQGTLFHYSLETTHPVILQYFTIEDYNKHNNHVYKYPVKESKYIKSNFSETWEIPKDNYYLLVIDNHRSQFIDNYDLYKIKFNFKIETKMVKYEDSHNCNPISLIVPVKDNDIYILNTDYNNDNINKVWWKCH